MTRSNANWRKANRERSCSSSWRLEDLTEAADLFGRFTTEHAAWTAGFPLEVSPLLAHDTKSTVAEAKNLHARAQRPIY